MDIIFLFVVIAFSVIFSAGMTIIVLSYAIGAKYGQMHIWVIQDESEFFINLQCILCEEWRRINKYLTPSGSPLEERDNR